MEAIERLQSDSDRDVRYFAGRDEEVPYEGRGFSADQLCLMRTTSRESLEDDMIGHSPLAAEFAQEQLQAKLCAVESTNRGEDVVMGIQLEVLSDEKFEDAELDLDDKDSEEHNGDENETVDLETGDESAELGERDESHAEETGHRETEVTQSEEGSSKDNEVDSSNEQDEAAIVNEV